MRRRSVAALMATAWLAIGPARASDSIDRYAGGGRSASPDSRWSVYAPPTPNDAMAAGAWLERSGKRVSRLMTFERAIDVAWPSDDRHVLIVDMPIHLQRTYVFALERGSRQAPDRIERDIERRLRATGPRLGSVENRLIAIGGYRGRLCALVEENGLPPGRSQGSFIARRAAFALDLDAGHAMPISACSGARID